MKNKLIIETLIVLAIFAAGVGFGVGVTEIHHTREAKAIEMSELSQSRADLFNVARNIYPCFICHGEK